MTSSLREERAFGDRFDFPAWVLWTAAALVLAAAGVYAYSIVFSQFAIYDDQGFMMITVRSYLEGRPLYNGVSTAYGPAYYFYEWVTHKFIGLPVTHDVTGLMCTVHWLGAAVILALAAFRVSGSPLLGFFVFMQAIVHLTELAREPGHPQELVVILLALAALIATRDPEKRWTLVGLGVVGACLVFTKINVGAFYGMALILALVCYTRFFQSRRALVLGVLVPTSVLPFLLMREQLTERWAWDYAWQIGAAALGGGIAAYSFATRKQLGLAQWCEASIGFGAFLACFIGVLMFTGSSMSAMVDCLVTAPSKMAGRFCLPLQCPESAWLATASLAMAAFVVRMRDRLERMGAALAVAKSIYGIVGTLVLVNDPRTQMEFLLPWVWLALVRVPTKKHAEAPDSFFRTFLCLAAVWQGLQAYPVAGTQAVTGSFLLVLVYALCLKDAVVVLAAEPWLDRNLRSVVPRTAVLFKYLIFAGLLYLFGAKWCNPLGSWCFRGSLASLGLPGAQHLRMGGADVKNYRALTDYVESHCDTFVTFGGLNSIYFWTDKPPLTRFNFAEVMLLSDRDQDVVAAALKNSKRSLVVINERRLPFVAESDVLGSGPLARFIREECHEVKRLGPFRILAPKAKASETTTASARSFS
jgi:hypothetical protein